jgi:predicted nucleotidyltransferase
MSMGPLLDDLLGTRSHVRVLRTLHRLLPGIALSGRDIARRSGVSHPSATAGLRTLADAGLVRIRRSRRADYYEMNRDHVLAADMARLFDQEDRLRDALVAFIREQLMRHELPVSEAYLFGSAARGERQPTSDIDLALIAAPDVKSEVEEAAFGPIAEAIFRRFGGRLSPIVGSPTLAALGDPAADGHALWERIGREGIPILRRSRQGDGPTWQDGGG